MCATAWARAKAPRMASGEAPSRVRLPHRQCRIISLTDQQLDTVMNAARQLPPIERDAFQSRRRCVEDPSCRLQSGPHRRGRAGRGMEHRSDLGSLIQLNAALPVQAQVAYYETAHAIDHQAGDNLRVDCRSTRAARSWRPSRLASQRSRPNLHVTGREHPVCSEQVNAGEQAPDIEPAPSGRLLARVIARAPPC